MTGDIPQTIAKFAADHLRSVDDLHVLVTCAQSGGRWWDANAIGRELQMPANAAHRVLEHLAQHNLLDVRVADKLRYQFRPGNARLADVTQHFLAAFSRRPLAITRLVALNPSERPRLRRR